MKTIVLKSIYIALIIGISIIRRPHEKRNKENRITTDNKTNLEKILLFLIFLGMMPLPLIYILTPLFSFANYTLPLAIEIMGVVLIIPTLWLFYLSHRDLGRNWSVTLEIRKDHQIVESGIYRYIRHPMYAAIWLGCFVQAACLQNYIAGLGGLIGFGLLYFLRVNKEEEMMQKEFGQAYEDYKKKTKRLIPFVY